MKQLTQTEITAIIQKANIQSDKCQFCGNGKIDMAISSCYTCTQKIIKGDFD